MPETTRKVAVLGGGSFGTAISHCLARNGHAVYQWMRREEQAEAIRRDGENGRYMPGYPYPDNLHPTSDLAEALADCGLVFVSIPSQAFRSVAAELGAHIDGSTILVSTTKGIEAGSFKLMSEILKEETCALKIGVLSGPNLAKEMMQGIPTGTVIASRYDEVIGTVQPVLSGQAFRVYANHDVFGVELAGALKNIYAVASGVLSARQLGENTRSMIMTRSLAEMGRFAQRLGADPMTFLGLAGVGDLIATCSSPLSRNFRVGFEIGSGKSLQEAVDSLGQVAEGVTTIRLVKHKADELGVRMPLVQGLYALLFDGAPLDDVAGGLMAGDFAADVEFVRRSA